jgi:hypothetical protein
MAEIRLEFTNARFTHTFPTSYEDPELRIWIAQCEAGYARCARERTRFTVLIDTSRCGMNTSTQRREIGAHLERCEGVLRGWCDGTALVVTNSLVRGLITAIWWFAPPSHPATIVSSIAEGETWLRDRSQRSAAA